MATQTISFTITEENLKKLEKLTLEERRSRSNMIDKIIGDYNEK